MVKRILLFFDDFVEMQGLQTNLKKIGFDCEAVSSVVALSERLLSFSADAIFISDRSGRLSIRDTAERLKSTRSFRGKVLALLSRHVSNDELLQIRVDALIEENCPFEKLVRVLAHLLDLNAVTLIEKWNRQLSGTSGSKALGAGSSSASLGDSSPPIAYQNDSRASALPPSASVAPSHSASVPSSSTPAPGSTSTLTSPSLSPSPVFSNSPLVTSTSPTSGSRLVQSAAGELTPTKQGEGSALQKKGVANLKGSGEMTTPPHATGFSAVGDRGGEGRTHRDVSASTPSRAERFAAALKTAEAAMDPQLAFDRKKIQELTAKTPFATSEPILEEKRAFLEKMLRSK